MDIRSDESMAASKRSSSSFNAGGEAPKAPWEIDLSDLEINDFVKQGLHGTLFCGKYHGRDVAVKLLEWGRDGHSTSEEIARLGESLRKVTDACHEMDHPHCQQRLAHSLNTVNFALAMARGLSYLHSRKIVHRSVKTENMLLDDKLNLKIVDFDVACIDSDPNDITALTGTPCYMAPEHMGK
uniref:Protein kinase domain-containing protein n=1 Tax=Oryza brachyantha TaxID=4533 RepID=J3N708_ORYBR